MKKFFTHRSKSAIVYKRFWQEHFPPKKPKFGNFRQKLKLRKQKTKKKNKYIRSKSMFFQFSTIPDKFPSVLKNEKMHFDYIQNALSVMRKNYVLRIQAIRRKVNLCGGA